MEQTSIDSYKKLKEDGVLSQRLWEALEYICSRPGGCVARVIPNNGWKRLSVLEKMGLIRSRTELYHDDVTNRSVKCWMATSIPVSDVKPVEKEVTFEQFEEELEKKITFMEQKQREQAETIVKLDEACRMLHLALTEKVNELEALKATKKFGIIQL